MSSIDEVIARSREPGQFQERRQFTIARGRAIQKLREFALVDPHHYMLELIQSAIANGATYIDIDCQRTSSAISYTGGYFPQNAMAQLFDFLFASEDDVEHGPLRQMALGVNALMRFKPDLIAIETGDGTLQGTTRIEIRDDDTVDVGTPEKALDGTFLRATGLSRLKLGFNSSMQRVNGHQREFTAIEKRCIVAPVPIFYNQDPIFGYTSQRIPESLFGFRRTVDFDEGDLYGSIGVARRTSQANFRLLTHGVWIESKKRSIPLPDGETADNLGGVITFEKLRKTADHGAIVEDDRYAEMWVRLQPYINQLVGISDSHGRFDVQNLDGQDLDNQQTLEILRQSERVILYRRQDLQSPTAHQRARAISQSLGYPTLSVGHTSYQDILTLAGQDSDLVRPDLDDDALVDFYTQRSADLPPRPWLTSPIELGQMGLKPLLQAIPEDRLIPSDFDQQEPSLPDWVFDHGDEYTYFRKAMHFLDVFPDDDTLPDAFQSQHLAPLGEPIRAWIYTPAGRQTNSSQTHNAEVRSRRRVVWTGEVDAVAPGQTLLVEIDDISPTLLWSHLPQSPRRSRAAMIADAIVHTHLAKVEQAADHALRAALRTDIDPGTNAARLALATLSRRLVKRIRPTDDHRRLGLSLVDPELDATVLDRPLLRSLDGQGLSINDLIALVDDCQGLLYAVRADIDADLDDLDTSRILVVDEALEDILIALVGPTAYIRVDERDLVADFEGVRCRDIAVGLRAYPDFPLLVEGVDPTDWSTERQARCLTALVEQLRDVIALPAVDANTQELRRHAWRHLQWCARHLPDHPDLKTAGSAILDLPLYATSGGETISHRTLIQALDSGHPVEMIDGRARGAGEQSFHEASQRLTDAIPDDRPLALAMNPFVLHLLGDQVCGAAEYALSQSEVDALDGASITEEALMESQTLADDQLQGVLGLPLDPPERPALLVFGSDDQPTRLHEELGHRFGIVGKLQLRPGVTHDDVEARLHLLANQILTHLLARLPVLAADDDPTHFHRALQALLDYAGHHLHLRAGADHTVRSTVDDNLAEQILHTPLIPSSSGLPLQPMAIVHDFQHQAARHLLDPEFSFEPQNLRDLPQVLQDWVDEYLHLGAIHQQRPKPPPHAPTADDDSPSTDEICLATTLQHWITRLHPAPSLHPEADLRVIVHATPFEERELAHRFCQLLGSGSERTLAINPDHWLTRWTLRSGDHSPRPLAWAILSAYAHINNMMEQVTNHHELICQQQLLDALDQGALTLLSPDSQPETSHERQ